MPGTKEGGRKAAETIRAKYGNNFYTDAGRLGGEKSRGGGFAYGEKGRERARKAGAKGGRISRRGPNKPVEKSID